MRAQHNQYLERWRGGELNLVYDGVRLESEGPRALREYVSDPRLGHASIDLMSIPVYALARQLGQDVTFDLRVEASVEGAPAVVSKAIFVGRSQPPQPARIVSEPASEVERSVELHKTIAHQLSVADFPASTTEVRVYVGFDPYVSVDASEWVDWLAPRDKSLSRAELMREGESLRRSQLEAIFEASRVALATATNCVLVAPSIATNAGWFQCPLDEVEGLADLPGVRDLALDWPGRVKPAIAGDALRADTGAQLRLSLTPPAGVSLHDGMTPLPGSPNSRIRAALVDPDGYFRLTQHPAFDDRWGVSRVIYKFGVANGYVYNSYYGGDPQGHGSHCVAPFGNVLNGQDSHLASNLWESHSYAAHGAHLVTYWASGTDMPVAIENAADPLRSTRADIIETSVATDVSPDICSQVDSFSDWRDAWDFAAANGAVGVIPAGNHVARYNDDCTANALATRDDMLMVGGFNNNVWNSDPAFGYPDTDMSSSTNCGGTGSICWRSAIGGGKLRFRNYGVLTARSRIDLMASHYVTHGAFYYADGTYGYQTTAAGTSISAPIVAASLVSLLDWAGEQGYGLFADVGFKHVNMLLMADGARTWDRREENPGAGPLSSYSRMHDTWGAGRFKMRRLDSTGMNDPFAWGTGNLYLNDNQRLDVPIGSGPFNQDVDEWVGVAAWDEPNITPSLTSKYAARVTMQVVYTTPSNGQCPNPGGSGGTVLYSDSSFDTHKLIRIQSDRIDDLWNQCAWIRFIGTDIPPGADGLSRRLIYRADFWEDRDDEWWEPPQEVE